MHTAGRISFKFSKYKVMLFFMHVTHCIVHTYRDVSFSNFQSQCIQVKFPTIYFPHLAINSIFWLKFTWRLVLFCVGELY